MKKYSDLVDIQNLKQKQKCSTTPVYQDTKPLQKTSNRVNALFTALANIFFERFTGRFPNPEQLELAKRLWDSRLQNITNRQIRYALNQCANWTQDFAPTLPQFLSLCHQSPKESNETAQLKYIPVADTKTAELHIDKLRQVLGMNPKYSANNA